jgi:predicted nucleotidyltransferase
MMNLEEILKGQRGEILAIAAKYGGRNVRIFGSIARGEADAESDVDLLVEPLPGFTLLKSSAMTRELEGLLGRKVDVVSERALRDRIRDRVIKEAVPL